MAGPTYGAAGTYLAGTGSSMNVAVPAGVAADHIIVVFAYVDSTTTVSALASGFAQATSSPQSTTNQANRLYVMWKRATGADSGTYNFTLSASAYREAVAVRYSGAITSGDPWNIVNAAAQDRDIAASTPAVSVTTTVADTLLVWAATYWAGGAWTPPSGFTERVDNAGEFSVADKAQAAIGGSGSVSTTVGSSTFSTTAWLGALKPPGGSPDATVTASVVAATATVGAPTVTTGSTVAPATVAAAATVPAPALKTGETVPASTVALTATVPTVAVSAGGNATVAASVVAATATVGAPTLSTGEIVAAATVAAAATVGTPTLKTGSTVAPSTVAAAATVGAAAVSAGQRVAAVTVAAVATVGAPTIALSVAITPAGIALTATVGAPTVTTTSSAAVLAVTVAALARLTAPTVTVGGGTSLVGNAHGPLPLAPGSITVHTGTITGAIT